MTDGAATHGCFGIGCLVALILVCCVFFVAAVFIYVTEGMYGPLIGFSVTLVLAIGVGWLMIPRIWRTEVFPPLVTYQRPEVVNFEGRRVEISRRPVKDPEWNVPPPVTCKLVVTGCGPDELRLGLSARPSWPWILGLCTIGVAGAFAGTYFWLIAKKGYDPELVVPRTVMIATWALIWCVGGPLAGVWMSKQLRKTSVVFDRREQIFTISSPALFRLRTGPCDMRAVAAVQLLHTERMAVDWEPVPWIIWLRGFMVMPRRRRLRPAMYEVNIVLATTGENRVTLARDTQEKTARAVAKGVSDFLGVPLIDDAGHAAGKGAENRC